MADGCHFYVEKNFTENHLAELDRFVAQMIYVKSEKDKKTKQKNPKRQKTAKRQKFNETHNTTYTAQQELKKSSSVVPIFINDVNIAIESLDKCSLLSIDAQEKCITKHRDDVAQFLDYYQSRVLPLTRIKRVTDLNRAFSRMWLFVTLTQPPGYTRFLFIYLIALGHSEWQLLSTLRKANEKNLMLFDFAVIRLLHKQNDHEPFSVIFEWYSVASLQKETLLFENYPWTVE